MRTFGTVRALDGLDLQVPAGSLFALVGANGAGKSTAIRVFTGLISAASGSTRVLGLDPRTQRFALLDRIGVVPDFPVLFDVLTPRENVAAISRVRGMAWGEASRRLQQLAEPLALRGRLDTPVAGLSNGERKKAALLAAMLHAPAILFLDEPFEGIDPLSSRTIRDMLDRLRERGVTVFLTSHVLPLIESIATHVAIIEAGRTVAAGPLDAIRSGYANLEAAVLDRIGRPMPVPDLDWYVLR